MLRELTTETRLCRDDGRLDRAAVGFSRTPVHVANVPRSLRAKRWDYWAIATPDAVLAITLADVGYLGLAVASVYDVARRELVERVAPTPFGRGISLSDRVRGTSVAVARRGLSIRVDDRIDETEISLWMRSRGVRVDAHATIDRRAESLSVVVPWSDERYQLTTKAFAMPVRGAATIDGRRFSFGDDAHACLDFGRGVWPYRTTWCWAVGVGEANGARAGFNFGGEWTTGTGATENGVLAAGRLEHVADDLVFELDDEGAPRRIVSRPGAIASIELTFSPVARRSVDLDVLAAATSLRWAYGRFRGVIATPSRTIGVDDFTGWAERHRARW